MGKVKLLINMYHKEESNKRYKPQEFINLTILLGNIYNFYKVLEENGIVPSEQKVYKLTEVRKVIEEFLKVKKFDMQCEKNNTTSYFSGVRFCLDLDYNPIDCPKVSNSCRKNIKYQVHPLVKEE